ncbi:MAG: hypothetical protein A2Y33_06085 [Spirochaetes bacterium GWF1_51_8]|nr:MAG: hypothetical protein A2Y33_06085 [Spirochaetes bacterium GWF1_51_8]
MKKSGILSLLAVFTVIFFIAGCAIFVPINVQLLPMKGNGTYTYSNAQLTIDGGMRMLKMQGSHYEMGYAYGYLLGNEIINTLQHYVYWVLLLKYPLQTYDDVYSFQAKFDWDPGYSNEMVGMLEGIYATVPESNLMISPPNGEVHKLGLKDLMVINTIGDWTCSSFAAWGPGQTTGNGMLLARNFDYLVDSSSMCKMFHMVTVCKPNDGSYSWVGVGVCGVLGAMTGMNQYGVAGVLHNTDFFPTTDDYGYMGRLFALRKILELTGPAQGPSDVETLLDGYPAYYGNNIFVCFSNTSLPLNDQAAVFEYDGDSTQPSGRATVRYASDNATLPNNAYFIQSFNLTNCMINVNHYLKRKTSAPGYTDDSGERYVLIQHYMTNAILNDGNVTESEAKNILMYVDDYFTLHSVIFEPRIGKLIIYLNDTPNKTAWECKEYNYTLTDLFNW